VPTTRLLLLLLLAVERTVPTGDWSLLPARVRGSARPSEALLRDALWLFKVVVLLLKQLLLLLLLRMLPLLLLPLLLLLAMRTRAASTCASGTARSFV